MAQLLHHNPFGYTARCPRAVGFVHLCFGTVGLALTPPELAEFRTLITRTYRDYATGPSRDPDARCIAVRTAVPRMALVFTFTELTELLELLDCTALLLEAEELLKG